MVASVADAFLVLSLVALLGSWVLMVLTFAGVWDPFGFSFWPLGLSLLSVFFYTLSHTT